VKIIAAKMASTNSCLNVVFMGTNALILRLSMQTRPLQHKHYSNSKTTKRCHFAQRDMIYFHQRENAGRLVADMRNAGLAVAKRQPTRHHARHDFIAKTRVYLRTPARIELLG
jgi:hypothetical protein